MMKKLNRTALFLILTFAVNYLLIIVFKLLGGQYDGISKMIIGSIYMLIPMIIVVFVKKVIYKEKLKTDLLVSFRINRWFFIAWLAPVFFSFCTIGINILFPGIDLALDMTGFLKQFPPEQMEQIQASIPSMPISLFLIIILGQSLIAGITVNALFAFGEEIAWRGFLLKEFKNMCFIKASLIIGFIWGIWHAPLILMGHNYPKHPYIGVFMMIAWCILLTPFFIYVTIKSKSVIAAAIMHGTLNGVAGISILFVDGGNVLTNGAAGLAGFIVLLLLIIILFIYDNKISRDKIMVNAISKGL
jgi:membrane protease YdiL (CAAX protease family)